MVEVGSQLLGLRVGRAPGPVGRGDRAAQGGALGGQILLQPGEPHAELVAHPGGLGTGHLGGVLVGAFPDPWDLVAYAIGMVAALTWERRSVRSGDQAG
ncbi:hypothetical protein [Streptosporangium sp. NPDC003464]